MIAAISTDNKVEHLFFRPQAINQHSFCEFLIELRRKLRNEKVVLFMDQLAVHSTEKVRNKYDELKFETVMNVKYMPDFQPIETVFAHVKKWYTKERLNLLANSKDYDTKTLVKKAFSKIRATTIQKCIERSLQLINS